LYRLPHLRQAALLFCALARILNPKILVAVVSHQEVHQDFHSKKEVGKVSSFPCECPFTERSEYAAQLHSQASGLLHAGFGDNWVLPLGAAYSI
jgi:hypothetical protein